MESNISQGQSDDNEAQRVQEEQRMRDVLATILDTAARERRMLIQSKYMWIHNS